jgi:hypothetical protein
MKNSEICLSIRGIRQPDGHPGSFPAALELVDRLRPTRVEWSYITDRDQIAALKQCVPVFVAALNTIRPTGHALSFEGASIVAPWMKAFGTPRNRMHYMCQNNPQDVQARLDQALDLIADGVTESFQHDDWYCNAQMIRFGNPCFCEHCLAAFDEYLGMGAPFDYRVYLRQRGIRHTAQLLERAQAGEVPLWDDFRRFAEQTVSGYFRQLKAAMDRFAGHPTSLSVNGSVLNFGGRLETILSFVDYLHGETRDFSPSGLVQLADASRELDLKQVVSFYPEVPPDEFHMPAFIERVNAAIALCYCVGLLPLYPYDVWAGPGKPRWFGTWDEYGAQYERVREHPEWFDEYAYDSVEVEPDRTTVIAQHREDPSKQLEHVVYTNGAWETQVL